MKIRITTLFITLLFLTAFSKQKMAYGTFKRIQGFPKDLPRPKMDTLEFPIFIGKQYLVLKRFKKFKFTGNEGSSFGPWRFLDGMVELTFLSGSEQKTWLLQLIQTKKNTYLQDPNCKFRIFKKINKRPKFRDKHTDMPYAGKRII